MANDFSLEYNSGDIIANNYKVIKELHSDDVGVTYLCTYCEYEDRFAAVKLLFPFIAEDKRARARVQQAITASYQVTHPNVIRTYEYIKEQNIIGYSMEYVDGYFLSDILHSRGKLPPLECAKLLLQICAGTYAIHSANIIHRNLKPNNIIVKSDDSIKIGNFVFARDRDAAAITEQGGIVGTLTYMSPEYLKTGEFDFCSDLYAIGIIAYEMLTGSTPTKAASAIEFIQKRTTYPIQDFKEYRIDCPQKLEEIIMKSLKIEAKDRFQSALEMQKAFEDFIKSPDIINVKKDLNAPPKPDIEQELNSHTTTTIPKDAPLQKKLSEDATHADYFNERSTLNEMPNFEDLKQHVSSKQKSIASKIILFFKDFHLSKQEIIIILIVMLITILIKKYLFA